jgi:hypothetical protein
MPHRHHPRHARVLLTVLATILVATVPVAAAPLPDIDIALTVEVQDPNTWLQMHEEVLATPPESAKRLTISVDAATGGRRAITVAQPRFDTTISLVPGARPMQIVVAGKVQGADALSTLTQFEWAILSIQVGHLKNELSLSYSLSAMKASLIEMKLSRP